MWELGVLTNKTGMMGRARHDTAIMLMALNTEFTHRAHPKVMVSIGNDPDGNHHFI